MKTLCYPDEKGGEGEEEMEQDNKRQSRYVAQAQYHLGGVLSVAESHERAEGTANDDM